MIYYSENNEKKTDIDLSYFNDINDSYLSVTQLNTTIKEVLDETLSFVKVKGEVSSITFHTTGHIYFTLKDADASVDGVVFKNLVRPEYKKIKVGDSLCVRGNINLYVKGGKYSLNTFYMQKAGAGELFSNFLALKEKLEQEGLFSEEIKKPLPSFIKKIALVTSETGAALKDFLHIAKKRFCLGIEFIIIPSLVQGGEAPLSLIQSLTICNKIKDLDVILITRGGGSYEDLECFNDENLARTIHKCKAPVVSAIGHERDFTICDFVADFRASTPSHAAEALIPSKVQILSDLTYYNEILQKEIQRIYVSSYHKLTSVNPALAISTLQHSLSSSFNTLSTVYTKLNTSIENKLNTIKENLKEQFINLTHFNPLNVFSKGYAFIQDSTLNPVFSVNDVKIDDTLSLSLKDGKINTKVVSTKEYNKNKETTDF